MVSVVSSVLLLAALVPIATASSSGAAPTTIRVPLDQPTITAALAIAVDGDTITVAPGTYAERLEFSSKNVTVISTGGPGVTTIDAAGLGNSVVRIGPGGTIQGFTLRNGNTGIGGGMRISGDGSTVRDNRFVGNSSWSGYGGAAIAIDSGSPLIERNLFTGNSCQGDTENLNGVVSMRDWWMSNPIAPVIRNNVFVDNPCDVDVRLFMGSAQVTNNTIVGGGVGIAVNVSSSGYLIRNNIIADQAVGIRFEPGATVAGLDHNLVGSNTVDYAGGASQTGANGNITGDPIFIDRAALDLRIAATSPGVDAGAATGAPSVDFDGSTRPLDGPDTDTTAEFDIGAYERDGTEPPVVPNNGSLDRRWSSDGLSLVSSRYSITLGPTGDGGTFVGSYKATDGNGPMRISKLTTTGASAAGWGSAGYVLRAFQPGGLGVSFPIHVIPVGLRITVVGEHSQSTARLGVARLRSDGSYDPAFSADGRALYKVFPTEHDVVSSFRAEVLTGGKIGIAAYALDYDAGGNLVFTAQAMLRLNSNGSLDTTFSGDGVAVIPNAWSDIRWRPNGSAFVGVQGTTTHQVRKLLPSGQLDTTFSGDGIASAACGTHRGASMGIDTAGRPLLMCVKPTGTSVSLATYRFTTTGGFDTSYSGDGKTLWVIPSSNGDSDELTTHFDSTGKPWVAAGGPGATTVLRVYTLDSSGNPDSAFSGDGQSSVTLPFNVDLSGLWRSGNRLFVTNYVGSVNVAMIALTT